MSEFRLLDSYNFLILYPILVGFVTDCMVLISAYIPDHLLSMFQSPLTRSLRLYLIIPLACYDHIPRFKKFYAQLTRP